MSMYGETRRTFVAPVGERLASLLVMLLSAGTHAVRWCVAVGEALERRRVMAQLAGLEDHMLKDIGITRADVRDAASEPFGTDPTRLLVLRSTERRAARLLMQRRMRQG